MIVSPFTQKFQTKYILSMNNNLHCEFVVMSHARTAYFMHIYWSSRTSMSGNNGHRGTVKKDNQGTRHNSG